MRKGALISSLVLAGSLVCASALAQEGVHGTGSSQTGHGLGYDERGAAPPQHETGHEHAAGHGEHDGPPGHINWIYGFLGTDAEAEPSILWRKPDMPPPFAANLLNFAVFAYVLVRFGKKPLQEGLLSRKKSLMREIDSAQKMKDEASVRLAQYEEKLAHIDEEIARIRADFQAQGERERARIVADAEEKRERMLKDAQFMIEQEAKQVRLELMHEAVEHAVSSAQSLLASKVSGADQAQAAEDYLKQLSTAPRLGLSKGGQA